MGLPFSQLWVTVLILGARNCENSVFCGSLVSGLDFGTKSDEFLRYLGWLKQWLRIGEVVKITVSVEHGFSRFGAPF